MDEVVTAPRVTPTFERFYTDQYPALLRIAWILTGRRDVAEEHVQESLLTVYRNWGRVSTLESPGGWARHVLTNRCVSTARRRATEARMLLRLGSRPAARVELDEPDDALWAAVRTLPRRQAQVITLVYGDDLAIRDVAQILGCSEPTARTHLRRGRAALAALLDLDHDEGGEP